MATRGDTRPDPSSSDPGLSPIHRSSILLGRVMADAITMLIEGAIIVGIAVLMGARPPGRVARCARDASLCDVVRGRLGVRVEPHRASHQDSELNLVAGLFLTLPALFLTPAFFPEPLPPGWLQAVATGNPAAYVIETGKRLMSIGHDRGQDLRTLIALVVAGFVLAPGAAAVAAFRATTK